MAENGVAWAMNSDNAWNAAALRHLAGALMLPSGRLSSPTGKRIGTGLELSINGSNQPVVQAGSGVIAGPADGDGAYEFAVGSAVTLATAIPLAGAGLQRHDRMVVQLRDADVAAFGTALREVSVERLAGTEVASSPSPVAEPLGAITVGLISVTASARSLLSYTVPRTAALGGIVPVATSTVRDALPAYDGLMVYREDTDVFEGRVNGAWTTVGGLGFIGGAQRTSNLTLGAAEANVVERTFTAVAGATYRVTAQITVQSDTAGHYTRVRLRHGATPGGVSGTQFQEGIKDHRVAARDEGLPVIGDFVAPSSGSYTAKLTADSSSTGQVSASATAPSKLYVDRIV